MSKQHLHRREFLKVSAVASGAAALVACLPQAATPEATPGTIGAFRLGKFEGPTIVTDSAKVPKSFKEAPELAELVRQGKLPPVAERIGQDPIVVQPVHGIGKYGGTLRKVVFQGVDDLSIARFMTGPAPLLFWDLQLKTIVPNIARAYEMSADQRTIRVQLRRGMKWSDGQPFTADDILFWFEDIYNDETVHPGDSPDLQIAGKNVIIRKIDETTLEFVSPQANPLLLEIMAAPTSDLGGQFRQHLGRGGPYAPKHYLRQFHAKYVGVEQANRLAASASAPNWQQNVKNKARYAANPELPVFYPWVVKTAATDPTNFVLERNPYSIWVDTEGNQLPYVGSVNHTVITSPDVMVLKTAAGEVDFMELQYTAPQLPFLKENEERGEYKVALDPSQKGLGIALNLAYDADPIVGELIRNVDFRRALALGIDREQINEAFFLGTGTPSSLAPTKDNKYYPGDEWSTKWATLDIAQANQLLDKIGLTQKDAAGYRLRSDGKRLTLNFLARPELLDQASAAEMVKLQWAKLGIDLIIDAASNALVTSRINANQAQMIFNQVGSDEAFVTHGFHTPTGGGFSAIMGIPYGDWYRSGGARGKEPFAALKEAFNLLDRGRQATSAQERLDLGKELTRLAVDNVFAIGVIVGDLTQGIRTAKNNLANVPARTHNSGVLLTPTGAMAQTYYFK